LLSTSCAGRKKLVPKCRSNTSMMQAATSAGKASRPRIATRNMAHMVSGMRNIDRPFVRRFRMVVTKLRPPIVNEAMKNVMPMIHSVWPVPDPGTAPLSADSGG
jgi:hypothetical protein